jgi:hypothetical protein
MAANTGFLATNQLDFFQLKENFKQYLRGKPEYTDFDFEGSNLSTLLDVLSYNTYLNAYYLNQVGSEMFLDTAQIKESVVSHAKELNYIPRSRSSARALVNMSFTPTNSSIATVIVPKFFAFQTTIDGTNLTFTTNENFSVVPVNGTYTLTDVEIFEGNIVKEFFEITSSNDLLFTLQSENIDISSIQVTVIESSTSTNERTWKRANSLFGLNRNSEVYFIQGHRANQYQLAFSINNTFGRPLVPGNIIRVEYRDTVGKDANGAFTFQAKSSILGAAVSVSTSQSARFGSDRETINEIKFNAPRFFQTQERGVTDEDFKALVKAQFQQVQSVVAYGGELAEPKQYGKVIISVKPEGREALATTTLKNQIKNFLKLKSLTTEPIVIDPEFFYLEVQSKIYYDPNTITNSLQNIRTNVLNKILSFNELFLDDFGKDFRLSRAISEIDSVDVSIVSNDTSARIIKKLNPLLNRRINIQFSFGNAIKSLSIPTSQQQPLGHAPMFDSSQFIYTDVNGVDRISRFQDNGRGVIFIYTIASDGTFLVLEPNVGTIDYATGTISITTNIKNVIGNSLKLYGRTRQKDIVANQNKFLIINPEDVDVSMQEFID